MNQDVKKQWIEALRSGRYRQGTNKLAYTYAGRDYFCCLGVLCDVLQIPYKRGTDNVRYYGERPCHTVLPREAQEAAGLDETPSVAVDVVKKVVGRYEHYLGDKTICLAHLNDHGVPFDKIADVIEQGL